MLAIPLVQDYGFQKSHKDVNDLCGFFMLYSLCCCGKLLSLAVNHHRSFG